MGVVYRARRPGLARDFALKLMSAEERDAEGVARFVQEARLAGKLDHPGVVRVVDVGEERGHPYYVMELCRGPTLEEHLARRGPLPEREAAELVARLARTMHHAHERGIVHRDLKPANVIVEEGTGLPRITDFGLARDLHRIRALTRSGDVLGTPYYMAPEQLRGKAGPRADVWALGVVLYEAVSGRRPFPGADFPSVAEAIRAAAPPPLAAVAPHTSPALHAIVEATLAKDPADRYISAAALAEDLEALARGDPPSHASGLHLPKSRRLLSRIAKGSLLVGLLVACGLSLVERARLKRERAARKAASAAQKADEQARRAFEEAFERARQAAWAPDADFAQALKSFRKAAEAARPGHDDAQRVQLERARFLLRRGRVDEARDAADALAEADPPLAFAARELLAQAAEAVADRPRAREHYETLRATNPTGPWGAAATAACRRLALDYEGALVAAERASASFRTHVAALEEHIGALLGRGAARSAPTLRRLVEAARRLAPPSPRLLAAEAQLEAATRNFPRARELAERAVAMGGERPHPAALAARAAVRYATGDLDGAVRDLERAQALGPLPPPAQISLGTFCWEQGRRHWDDPSWLERARALWRAAYEASPRTYERLLAGASDSELGRALRRAVEEHPPFDPWSFELTPALRKRVELRARTATPPARRPLRKALLGVAAGRPWEEVARLFATAREAAPRDPVVALAWARACVGREAPAEAERALERARELGAGRDEVDYLTARALWDRGKAHEAAPRYEALVRRLARRPSVLEACARASLLLAHDRPDEALKAVRRARRYDPEHALALILEAGLLLRAEPPLLDEAQRLVERALALEGASELEAVRVRLSVEEYRAILDSRGRPVAVLDDRRLRPLLELYERLGPLTPGTALLIDEAQFLLNLRGPNPYRPRVGECLEEAIRRAPKLGLAYSLLGIHRLRCEAPADEVLAAWRTARTLEPRLYFSEEWIEEFRASYGARPELEEFPTRPPAPRLRAPAAKD